VSLAYFANELVSLGGGIQERLVLEEFVEVAEPSGEDFEKSGPVVVGPAPEGHVPDTRRVD